MLFVRLFATNPFSNLSWRLYPVDVSRNRDVATVTLVRPVLGLLGR